MLQLIKFNEHFSMIGADKFYLWATRSGHIIFFCSGKRSSYLLIDVEHCAE
jgi:hypothetical protein